jgi:hypothetical protein
VSLSLSPALLSAETVSPSFLQPLHSSYCSFIMSTSPEPPADAPVAAPSLTINAAAQQALDSVNDFNALQAQARIPI